MTRCAQIMQSILSEDVDGKIVHRTQTDLADILQAGRPYVNMVLQNKMLIGPKVALRMEKEFNITAEEIVIASALDQLDKMRKELNDAKS